MVERPGAEDEALPRPLTGISLPLSARKLVGAVGIEHGSKTISPVRHYPANILTVLLRVGAISGYQWHVGGGR
jgi:hypothetical protein